ncbi:hypothetical protein Daus18300_011916 [Diaporthe australafricana]|uniref:Uncharacterized protein n=1 Tax=Diaporthe australafricana TaxID=127596 RepID=A0ABR3W4W8_9PEZI
MAFYVKSFPLADQVTLNRPDFHPRLHYSFFQEPTWSDRVVNRVWMISGYAHKSEIPRIRRQDLSDFGSIWLTDNFAETKEYATLRGFWAVDNRADVNADFVMIVQYKTFRLWLRRRPGQDIVLSTTDVANILSLCLSIPVEGDEMPCYVGDMVNSIGSVQWLISPVEKAGIDDSIKAFRQQAAAWRCRAHQNVIIAVLYSRKYSPLNLQYRRRDSRKIEEIFKRQGIDYERIAEARRQVDCPLQGFSSNRLEALLSSSGSDGDAGTLPLRVDDQDRAELYSTQDNLALAAMVLARNREMQPIISEQLTEDDEKEFKASLAHYTELREYLSPEDRPH